MKDDSVHVNEVASDGDQVALGFQNAKKKIQKVSDYHSKLAECGRWLAL